MGRRYYGPRGGTGRPAGGSPVVRSDGGERRREGENGAPGTIRLGEKWERERRPRGTHPRGLRGPTATEAAAHCSGGGGAIPRMNERGKGGGLTSGGDGGDPGGSTGSGSTAVA